MPFQKRFSMKLTPMVLCFKQLIIARLLGLGHQMTKASQHFELLQKEKNSIFVNYGYARSDEIFSFKSLWEILQPLKYESLQILSWSSVEVEHFHVFQWMWMNYFSKYLIQWIEWLFAKKIMSLLFSLEKKTLSSSKKKNMSGHFQISSSFENSDMPNTNFQTATITSIPWLIEVSNITIFAKKMYGNPIGKLAFGPTFTIAIQV